MANFHYIGVFFQDVYKRQAPTSKARNGDTVRVAFDPHKVHLFDIETELTSLN